MIVPSSRLAGAESPARSASRLLLKDWEPDLAARLRRLHIKAPAWNLVGVGYPLVWIITAVGVEYLTEGRADVALWLVRGTGIVLIGIFIQSIAILMHEALHGNLFKSTRWNSWAMFLCGAPALFSGTAYKIAHLNHHRHTRTDQDQDEIANLCKTPGQYRVLFYLWFFVGTVIYLFIVLPLNAIRIGTRSERHQIFLEYAGMFTIYIAVISWGISAKHADWLFWYWLLPIQVAMFLSNIRSLAEHLCTSADNVLARTRTTRSNCIVSFLMLNLNYHLEHHLFPGVPWYNLPKVHHALQPLYATERPYVERSYIRYALMAFLRGPFNEIRDIATP